MTPRHIFISYSRNDRSRAELLALALEKHGWPVWWDTTIPAGQVFDEVIGEAIETASCIVVLWSRESVHSRWVRTEAEEGLARQVLVPAMIERVKIPLAFRRIQSADLTGWDGAEEAPELRALLGAIADLVGEPPRAADSEAPGARPAQEGDSKTEPQAATESKPAPPAADLRSLASDSPGAWEGLRRKLGSPLEKLKGAKAQELRSAIARTLERAELKTSYGNVVEESLFGAWRELWTEHGEAGLLALADLAEGELSSSQENLKVLVMLKFGIMTPQGRRHAKALLAVAADHLTRTGAVAKQALKLIAEAPVPPLQKWNVLATHLELAAPESEVAVGIMNQIAQFTPPSERERTAALVAEKLMYATGHAGVTAAVGALKQLARREILPAVRDLLPIAPLAKANHLAGLAAHFGDRESAPAIRQAIESWRYGSDSMEVLVAALQALASPECNDYLGTVLIEAAPQLQKQLLGGSLSQNFSSAVAGAVGRVSASTDDAQVRELAERYLAKVKPA